MGKASRRKREQSAQAAPCDIRSNEKPTEYLRPFLRQVKTVAKSKVLGYALAAGIALGSLEIVREQIPYWDGSKPHYSVEFIFLKHEGDKNAELLLKEIDAAKAEGRPIKLLFIERVKTTESEYDGLARSFEDSSSRVRATYQLLLKQGLSPKEAEDECTAEAKTVTENDFSSRLYVGAAIRGIKILPLEAYSEEEHKNLSALNEAIGAWGKRSAELMATNATLNELMQSQLQLSELDYKMNYIRERNIADNLERRLDHAKALFPELKTILASQLNAVAYIGSSHQSSLEYKIGPSKSHIKFIEKVVEHSLPSRVLAQIPENRPLTKKEAYLVAIGVKYDTDLENMANTNPALYEAGVSNAMAFTEVQLENIDVESSKIIDAKARAVFILNNALNIPFFKP